MINCVDIFCGLGGLTHGLIKGGVHVVAGIDIDVRCRFPYEKNNNAAFVQSDIREIDGDKLRVLWGEGAYTLLAGCAPCQPFSTYSRNVRKKRRSSKTRQDQRWGLVSDFGRLIVEAQPDFVTIENVPQLMDHRVFTGFLDSLVGYHVWYDVVECACYGVPQTRKRLVLLASRLGPIILAEPSVINQSEVATVRAAISHLRALIAGESDPNDRLHSACRLSSLNLRRIRASLPGGTWRDWPAELVARCHRRVSGDTYPSVYGRMEWDALAPTITTQCFGYGNGRFGHPQQDRAITLREAAILQTFPETYEFLDDGESVCFYALGRLIGNAVPVRLAEVIAQSFCNHLSEIARVSASKLQRANEQASMTSRVRLASQQPDDCDSSIKSHQRQRE